jgi:hypothetical protein
MKMGVKEEPFADNKKNWYGCSTAIKVK